MKPISIITAPLVSEEFFSGVSMMADALLKAGVEKKLKAVVSHRLPLPNWKPKRDSKTKILNPTEVRAYSIALADVIGQDLKKKFPVVIGGDCTILLGAALAMKRQIKGRGKSGLFFIDGHADFYEPGISPSGETADMELGFIVGRGPEILANLEKQKPLVREEDVVLFGFRDEELIKQTGGQDVRKTKIHCVSLSDTRYYGFNNAIEKNLKAMTANVDSFWIHLDVDVMSDKEMPAVDYRMPDGLSSGEVINILQRLIATEKACGLSVSIFNPTLDHDGSLAKQIVRILASGLREKL